MKFTNEDLEAILSVALERAAAYEVEPATFEQIYRDAVAAVVKRKANDVAELYRSLQPTAWYVESFQMRVKREGNDSEIKGFNQNLSSSNWTEVFNRINQTWGTSLTHRKRGNGGVYVWLEKGFQEEGRLYSYGDAHRDGAGAGGRENMHYFIVVGDYNRLQRVVETFLVDPQRNMSLFTEVVFGWKNEVPQHMGGEPNLYTRLKELYVRIPGTQDRTVSVR